MTTPDQINEFPDTENAPPRGTRTMAIVRWVLVAVMSIVALGSAMSYFGVSMGTAGSSSKADGRLYYCPMHPQIVQDRPGECPICSMTLVPKPEGPIKASTTMTPAQVPAADAGADGKYYCPMHPHVRSDDPNAKCDLCGGMKLVPRPAASESPAPATETVPGLVAVDIPIERVQKIGIRTATVTRQSLQGDLQSVGVVEASERGVAHVTPRFSGWIETLKVSETGQRVRRGEVLATVYSPEVLQAQQELLTALGWTTSSPAAPLPHHESAGALGGLLADARQRLELLGISAQEIDAIAKSRKVQRAIPIRSPINGHVTAKSVVVGTSVSPGLPLFEVADLSTVWVIADIYESDIKRVRIGQPARFVVTAFAAETFTGKVQLIYPTLDAGSRTLRVRLEFRNRPGPGGLKLRPGMYGNVILEGPPTTGLTVPEEAIADTGEVQYLFVAKEGGRFEPRRIKLGARLKEQVQILEGVAEGETVVTTANFLVDSESRLRAAIEGQKPGR